MFEELFHALRHHLLHRIGMVHAVELLSPFVNLCRQVDLDRTNIIARTAQRAGRAIMIVLVAILEHTEIDADRTRDEIGV